MNFRKFTLVTGVLVIVLISGIITLLVIDPILWLIVYEKTELTSGTPTYEQWINPKIDIYFQAYFFNLTNPREFLNGAKPVVQQIGPYSYRERRFKTEVKKNYYPTTLEYKEVRSYYFRRESSVGEETDLITTVSLGYLGVDEKFGWLPSIITQVVEFLENRTDEHLIITRSVKELLWGYEDPFLKLLKSVFIPVPNTRIGLFLDKNYTDDGVIGIYGNNKDAKNFGQIFKYHGSSKLSIWTTDQANQINGSDGSLFHPFLKFKEHPYLFDSGICRSIQLLPQYRTRSHGVPTIRYVPYPDTFESALVSEKNRGFCIHWPHCLPRNLVEVTTCIPGAPIVMSLPHFLYGDASYSDSVSGLHPTEELNTTFYIEPITGAVFSASKKLQINAIVKQNNRFSELAHVKSVYLPIMFMNESFNVDPETAGTIRSSLYMGPLTAKVILAIVVVIVAILVLLMLAYYCVRGRHMITPSHAAYTTIDEQPDAPEINHLHATTEDTPIVA